jgi:hypothetical protein
MIQPFLTLPFPVVAVPLLKFLLNSIPKFYTVLIISVLWWSNISIFHFLWHSYFLTISILSRSTVPLFHVTHTHSTDNSVFLSNTSLIIGTSCTSMIRCWVPSDTPLYYFPIIRGFLHFAPLTMPAQFGVAPHFFLTFQ